MSHMVVQLASIVAIVREVEDQVSRRMLLIKERSNSTEVVLMEGVIVRIGHGCAWVCVCVCVTVVVVVECET